MARYEVLTTATAAEFARPFLDGDPIACDEIGDGNLNYVFRVSTATSSVIVKQAPPYLRVAGEGWPLSRSRAEVEARALPVHAKHCPLALPSLLGYDEDLSVLVLEDLREHITWREEIIEGRYSAGVAELVGRYCADVLVGTSDVALSVTERNALKRDFGYTDLCALTANLVLTAPFVDDESNRLDDHLIEAAAALRVDKALQGRVAELRFTFMTRAEALVHGDLHTGSVMVNGDDVRVIDLEFAFFGPLGLDPGMLMANLALSRLCKEVSGDHAGALYLDGAALDFWSSFVDGVARQWPARQPWMHRFLSGVLTDAARFAGAEMVRRIVGLAHVKDVDRLPLPLRSEVQARALAGGRALLLAGPVRTVGELWHIAISEDSYL